MRVLTPERESRPTDLMPEHSPDLAQCPVFNPSISLVLCKGSDVIKSLVQHRSLTRLHYSVDEVLLSSHERSPMLQDVPPLVHEVVQIIPVDNLFYLLTKPSVQKVCMALHFNSCLL